MNAVHQSRINDLVDGVFSNPSAQRRILIRAPTGYGKTLGLLSYFLNKNTPRDMLLSVEFVIPSRSAVQMMEKHVHNKSSSLSSSLRIMTQNAMIQRIIMNNGVDAPLGVVVLDECHVESEEMQFLKLYFKTFPDSYAKLVMVSATCPDVIIQKYFPDIVIYDLQPDDGSRMFQVEYVYSDHVLYNNLYNQCYDLRRVFSENIDRCRVHRIMVFCHSSAQCEMFMEHHKKNGGSLSSTPAFAYYSKMDDEEKRVFLEWVSDTGNSFVVFCTNVLETSITIPGVNYVVDLGKRFVVDLGNTLRIKWCDQSSMIQRAGRTGRTCDGKVIRIMTRMFFESLPGLEERVYTFESMLLHLYKKDQLDRFRGMFVDRPEVYGDFARKLRLLHIQRPLSSSNKKLKFDFVYRYRHEMAMENSVLLYKLYHRRYSMPLEEVYLMYLAVSVLISMDMINLPLLYLPMNMRKNKRSFFTMMKNKFDSNGDELRMYLNILINAMVSNNKTFIKTHCLNNKFVKDVRGRLMRYWNDAVTIRPIRSSSMMRDFTRDLFRMHPPDDDNHSTWTVPDRSFDRVQQFLLHHSTYAVQTFPFIDGHDHSNAFYDMFDFFNDTFRSYHGYRLIVLKCVRIHYDNEYTDTRNILWTRVKLPMATHQRQNEIRRLHSYLEEKRGWREEFQNVVREIDDEVAYRPGMWRMLEGRDRFYDRAVAHRDETMTTTTSSLLVPSGSWLNW